MATELEQAQENARLWQEEAKRWRDMYLEYDEMIESQIQDQVDKMEKIWAELDFLKREVKRQMGW